MWFHDGIIRTTPDAQYIKGANSGQPFTVNYDGGGDYEAYKRATEHLRATGQTVTVTGKCISGCTDVLSLDKKQVIVDPKAKFLIHGAYRPDQPIYKNGKVVGYEQDQTTTDRMMSRYPAEVRQLINAWAHTHGGFPAGRPNGGHVQITGAQLIALGWRSTDGRNAPARETPRPAAAATPDDPQVIYADGHRRTAPRSERPAPVTASFDPGSFFRGIAARWQRFWASIRG